MRLAPTGPIPLRILRRLPRMPTPKTMKAANRFSHERRLLDQGMGPLAGVDEAGRGPLAGPVTAAAVVFPCDWALTDDLPESLLELNDSKQLSERARERFFDLLHKMPEITFAIAVVSHELIDQLNILNATHLAMAEALRTLKNPAAHALVDGVAVRGLPVPHTPIVKGDSQSYSIAAASVLAKVTRDRIMLQYDKQYPEYGFGEHKGYPTKAHLMALSRHGPCPIHRRSFAPVRSQQLEF